MMLLSLLAAALPFTLAPRPRPNPADHGHFGPVTRADTVMRVDTQEKVVALTLDDGPSPRFTPTALALAKKEQIPITFFLVGQEAVRHPELVKEEAAAGHVIADHSWHHPLVAVGDTRGQWEVEETARLLQTLTGTRPTLFRPPGGMLNTGTAAYAKSAGFTLVTWDVFPGDTDPKKPAAALVQNVLAHVRPGSIILMHDGGGNRLQSMLALPAIVTALKKQGYRFVTVPELLALREPPKAPKQALQTAPR